MSIWYSNLEHRSRSQARLSMPRHLADSVHDVHQVLDRLRVLRPLRGGGCRHDGRGREGGALPEHRRRIHLAGTKLGFEYGLGYGKD